MVMVGPQGMMSAWKALLSACSRILLEVVVDDGDQNKAPHEGLGSVLVLEVASP
jgi:hypothetical protein